MESPERGLLCNLNHVHLQHISLGLHLSRHPELREETQAPAAAPLKAQTTCQGCPPHDGPTAVDANSNHPSLPCRCCTNHPAEQKPTLPVALTRHEDDEDDGLGSPSEPGSSSASSCSELSPDDSPVSVYYKAFPGEEAPSPESQPNIVPLEEARADERSLNLNIWPAAPRPSRVWDSPDSLCSASSLESTSDLASPSPPGLVDRPFEGLRRPAPPVPVRPCRAPPTVPVPPAVPGLDSNCNALPVEAAKPEGCSVDVNSNHEAPAAPRPRFGGVPPPVPPRTKRGLQGLRRGKAPKPVPPATEGPGQGPKKNITSFHELAQKRKKVATKKEQSDWLIVFSPDTEFPPSPEAPWSSAPSQGKLSPAASPPGPANAAPGPPRGVTTFKELRDRKQKGQLAPKGDAGQGVPESKAGGVPPPPPGDPRGPKEGPARRKKSRPGLQPIMEGSEDAGRPEPKPSSRSLEEMPTGKRDPWVPGKEERGSRGFAEVRHSQSFGGTPSGRRQRRGDVDRTSVQLREQKKALLVGISASVDKIVAHFSSARNVVQKAQLGDSRISPEVGYLVLNTLCPALRALVSDGLKPFQKDVITGQRPSSPWSVVEASAKPGPHTRSLNAFYWRVSRLAPLRNNQQRFHAFVLGLLNMKQLEQWFAHLQRNSELISAFYLPTAFLVLGQGFCRRWADELLLLLQPLSMLTFQLDLLFEHHHLPLEVRPASRQAVTSSSEPSPDSPPGLVSFPGPLEATDGISAGVALPRRLLQWGDRLTHAWLSDEASLMPEPDPKPETVQQEAEEKQHSWWKQLSQASGVYANPAAAAISKSEGFPYSPWSKLRGAMGEALKQTCAGMGEAVAGPKACPRSPGRGGSELTTWAPARKMEDSKVPAAGEHSPADAPVAEENPDTAETPGNGKGKRLGWLFGASSPEMPMETDSNPSKSRRPSSWLPPTMNVLSLVMRMGPAEKSLPQESWKDGSPDPLESYRAVRALCDHAGTEAGHLSFRKGDVLQILETVDEDWIRCCRGDRKGLVPVGYTSLLV